MSISQNDYMAMLARLNARLHYNERVRTTHSQDYERESELHQDIANYCKAKGWICFMGSTAHRTKRTIGEPDALIYADQGRCFLVECKIKGRKPTVEQMAILAWAKKLGHKAAIVESLAEFQALVQVSQASPEPQPSPLQA
jgi:hypothetical protein